MIRQFSDCRKTLLKGALLSIHLAATPPDGRKYSSRSCWNFLDEKEPTNKGRRLGDGQDPPRFKLTFPFKGKCGVTDQSSVGCCVPEPTFTVYKGNSSEVRTYIVERGDEVLSLPSVTTVLNLTLPKSRNFMLNNWKKGMVREYGEVGYQQVRDEIKAAGKEFHAVRTFTCEFDNHSPLSLLCFPPQHYFPGIRI